MAGISPFAIGFVTASLTVPFDLENRCCGQGSVKVRR
jgi:hypothetical protein